MESQSVFKPKLMSNFFLLNRLPAYLSIKFQNLWKPDLTEVRKGGWQVNFSMGNGSDRLDSVDSGGQVKDIDPSSVNFSQFPALFTGWTNCICCQVDRSKISTRPGKFEKLNCIWGKTFTDGKGHRVPVFEVEIWLLLYLVAKLICFKISCLSSYNQIRFMGHQIVVQFACWFNIWLFPFYSTAA